MEITKIEEGGLAAHTRFAYKRKVTWFADRYGYRRQNTNRDKYEMVIIGDSMAVGVGQNVDQASLENKKGLALNELTP
jgi:hypothetical protein